jgi:hypothetical protein
MPALMRAGIVPCWVITYSPACYVPQQRAKHPSAPLNVASFVAVYLA